MSSAADFIPAEPTLESTLESLARAAKGCRGCPRWRRGTQTVFGEGRASASLMLIGEQPGNEEDLSGHPFVGPAGKLLDRALEQADIERGDAYVTNVVKHFKWEQRGKRRLHSKPNAKEIGACLPWLERELDLVEPKVVLCLGATAAQALLGKSYRVTVDRGTLIPFHGRLAGGTVHPSSILRAPSDDERHAAMEAFIADLRVIAKALRAR
jgi:uracil-DNA glycosylase